MGRVLGKTHLEPCITNTYRMGDIRHCFADITQAQTVLGYTPRLSLTEGLDKMVDWLVGQIADDQSHMAGAELARRGLLLSAAPT
jgi:dTDP-L-rhamnose 4-epimerase